LLETRRLLSETRRLLPKFSRELQHIKGTFKFSSAGFSAGKPAAMAV
jgi:hypothetical protein